MEFMAVYIERVGVGKSAEGIRTIDTGRGQEMEEFEGPKKPG